MAYDRRTAAARVCGRAIDPSSSICIMMQLKIDAAGIRNNCNCAIRMLLLSMLLLMPPASGAK
eukprot:SAG31_NODE_38666_length_294_cov_1.056410_1_plen_62_part_01